MSEFSKRSKAKDGLQSRCATCNRKSNLAHYERIKIDRIQDPAGLSARIARRKKTKEECRKIYETIGSIPGRKIVVMHSSARHRAKKKKVNFDISPSDLLELYVEECPILKIKLDWGPASGRAMFDSPSLDRIVPSAGYVKGNLWIISNRANTIKSDATPEELLAVANAMLSCYSGAD